MEYLRTHKALQKKAGQFLPMQFGVVFTAERRAVVAGVHHRMRELGHGIPPEREQAQSQS